jgi:hypothetical protein
MLTLKKGVKMKKLFLFLFIPFFYACSATAELEEVATVNEVVNEIQEAIEVAEPVMEEQVLEEVQPVVEETLSPATDELAENSESETLTPNDTTYTVDVEIQTSGSKEFVEKELNAAVDEVIEGLQ